MRAVHGGEGCQLTPPQQERLGADVPEAEESRELVASEWQVGRDRQAYRQAYRQTCGQTDVHMKSYTAVIYIHSLHIILLGQEQL